MGNAAKIVSSSILGLDCKTVLINGKAYVISPPTIRKLAGAGYYLSEFDKETIKDTILSADIANIASALSFFIKGDDSLRDELLNGTFEEISNAMSEAYSLIDTKDFLTLSGLAKNVANLIAKQRQ